MKTMNELNIFLAGFIMCLENVFTVHTALLKCFIYSRVTVSHILFAEAIHVAPTMN